MHDPDFIWMGDQCIPPWDSRNILPEWERITATINNERTIRNSNRAKPESWAEGLVCIQDYADELGLSPRWLLKAAQAAGMEPVRKREYRQLLWKRKELDQLIQDRRNCPPDTIVTGYEAIFILDVDPNVLRAILVDGNVQNLGGGTGALLAKRYVISDIRKAITHYRSMVDA